MGFTSALLIRVPGAYGLTLAPVVFSALSMKA